MRSFHYSLGLSPKPSSVSIGWGGIANVVSQDGNLFTVEIDAEGYDVIALACLSLLDSLAAGQNPGFPESLRAGSPIRAFVVFPDRTEPGKLGSFSIQL